MVAVATSRIATTRRLSLIIAAGLAVVAVVLRLAWAAIGDHFHPVVSENYEIAQAIARTGVVADAYHLGSGPTAHAAPLWPAFAGTIYRLFGLHSTAAEVALTLASLVFVGVSVVALDRSATLLGISRAARLAAIGFIALVPLEFEIETELSRVWEQSVGAAALGLYLWLVLVLDARRPPMPWRSIAGLAALAAPLVMICPPVALGAYGCLGVLAWRRRGLHAVIVAALLSVGFVAVTAYPWALRNEHYLGEKIWLRSNFGFVFAEGFHAAAVDPIDPRRTFVARMAEIDPFERARGFRELVAHGGEAGYSRYWTARTMAWITANPAAAARIAVRHVGEFFLPPRWQWTVYSTRGAAVGLKQALTWAVTLLGFAGVAAGIGRDRRFVYPLAMLVLPVLPYIAAQPVIRYRYVIASLLVFLAADLVVRLIAARRRVTA